MGSSSNPDCPAVASFFSFLGIAFALAFTSIGSGYGTAKSAIGVFAVCSVHPDQIYRGLMPVIMAGILGIYGLIVSVILAQKLGGEDSYIEVKKGYQYLGSGLCCGLTSFAAGIAIGIGGEAGVRALGQQEKIFVGMMLILIFAEALGLYGLIVSLILVQ